MIRSPRAIWLLVAGLLLSARPAGADTLQFIVNGPLDTREFDPHRTSVILSFTGEGSLVTENATADLRGYHVRGYNVWVRSFNLKLSDLSAGAASGRDIFFGDLQLKQTAPVLSAGLSHLPDRTAVRVTSVPEPSTFLLLGTGLVALGVFRRFKKRPLGTGSR
jgi:PEP-CTERM motif